MTTGKPRINKYKAGFTLVEVIVVLVILGILLAIAVPSLIGYIDHSAKLACAVNIRTIQNDHILKLAARENKSLSEILAKDYNAGKDVCPGGGTYSVQKDPATGQEYVHCSKHGKAIYSFDFGSKSTVDAANAAAIKNLPQLLSAAEQYLAYLDAHGYTLKPDPKTSVVVDYYDNKTNYKINKGFEEYLGPDSGFNSTLNNFRITADAKGNVIGVCYKSGTLGYVIYKNTGNMYSLSNAYFTGNATYDNKAPISLVVGNEQNIFLMENYENECALLN